MTAVLTLIPGGRNRPEVIEVERRAWDEARMELATTRAERITFVTQVHHHVRAALLALAQVQPDADRAERYLVAAARLAIREATRLSAVDDDPAPISELRAAA